MDRLLADTDSAEEHTDDPDMRTPRPSAGRRTIELVELVHGRTATRTGCSACTRTTAALTLRALRPLRPRGRWRCCADGSTVALTHEYEGIFVGVLPTAQDVTDYRLRSPTTATASTTVPRTTPTGSCPPSARSTCT